MHPPFLKPGDTIAIAAPARSISFEQLKAAKDHVEKKGFKIFLHKDLYATENQFGGSDSERARIFNELIANTEVKAIWCARGGYGAIRMVDKIDMPLLRSNPKWLIGFSDITVIHSHCMHNADIPVIHATMPIFMSEKKGKELKEVATAIDSMLSLLTGDTWHMDLKANEKHNIRDFEGEIVGGNLSVLASIVDSASEISFDRKILFIEDLDEFYYHLDRMLLMFRRSGRLKDLKALLVGSFIDMHDHTVPFGKTTKDIILEHCYGYGFPIIFDINSGHHLQNMAIPLGLPVHYQNGILTFAGA